MNDLLPIGRFARLTGLRIGALRHYDEVGLLRPAAVDPSSGYRRYAPDQVDTGRLIGRLRDLDVPLETIAAVLATDDARERQRVLESHRARIEASVHRLQRVLHVIGQLSQGREPLMTEPLTTIELDPEAHRRLGKELYNRVWTLLETADRSPEQTDEMLHAAHASRYHWTVGGEPAHRARGEWQCSRVYAVLRRGEPALWHARRCVSLCEEHGLADWDRAAAYEAMARASSVAGDKVEARIWKDRATAALAAIADPEDRELIESDLATIG